jgi:murein DD-endopeptidase MepM/ murein hydrolase activator NlpD
VIGIGNRKRNLKLEWSSFREFLADQGKWWQTNLLFLLSGLGVFKKFSTSLLYKQRGKWSGVVTHGWMVGLVFLAVLLSSRIESLIFSGDEGDDYGYGVVLASEDENLLADTLVSEGMRGEILEYRVKEGDTVSSVAMRFGVSIDTIIWANDFKSVDAIKPGQILKVLPVTGIEHTVKRGETVYSIAKNYQAEAQSIVDFPFNEFANDETFTLQAGQRLLIPEGIKPKEKVIDTSSYVAAREVAPLAGVVGEGTFTWPTSGRLSQRWSWYHQAVDIANAGAPAVVASQGGSVVAAGWNRGGYGNYVIVDHGNGFKTLYAHLSSISVSAGQKVSQGQQLGIMGSTGRSTGVHLHFEVIGVNGRINPLSVLQ